LLPTAYSTHEEKHRKLKGGARLGRVERLPENFFVLHKGAVIGPLLFCDHLGLKG
jgi:hypothetical protein